MAKGCNNATNKKSNSSKPYDASNSFVKKVASRVTGLIPQPSWLSSWFSSSEASEISDSTQNTRYNRDEDFEDCLDQPPPSKRIKLPDRNYESEILSPPGASNDVKKSSQGDFMDMSSVPGPSGQQRVASGGFVSSTPAPLEQDRKANGDDCSESAESTSGCSSLEPQMNRAPGIAGQPGRANESMPSRFLDDRFNYPSYLQSPRTLFLERSSASRNNQSASRRKPSFCVTSLNSSLFGDRSLNETMVNSPFYSGRTMYGGASSSPYRRSVGSTSFSSSPAGSDKMGRHTVKVRPSPAQANVDTGMSETARRILATLEQFSTPLMDAKRIPVSSSPQPALASSSRKRTRQDTEEPRILLNSPRSPQLSRKGVHWAGGPPVNELTVPGAPDSLLVHRKERFASAADERLLRQKERLQDSTTAARRLANSVPASNVGLERTYTMRTEEDEPASGRQSLKMKSQLRTKHQSNKDDSNELPEAVNLPKIALPITTLPSFDIPVAKPTPPSPASSASRLSRVPPKSSSLHDSPVTPRSSLNAGPETPFTFASPIVVASEPKSTSPVAFVFSNPDTASKDAQPASGVNFLSSVSSRTDKAALKRKSVTVNENGGELSVFSLKPPAEVRTGSVMDVLGKRAKDSKEVSVMNGSVSLMDKFKPATGTWECDQCLIRNKPGVSRCVACTSPRPAAADGKGTSNGSTAPSGKPSKTTATVAETPAKSDAAFGAQFKLSGSDMWECSSCMVRNKSGNNACVACGGAKPATASTTTPATKPVTKSATASVPQESTKPPPASGWGDKFKPATNTWECEACMVRNAADLTACQACTTKRPGAEPAKTAKSSTPNTSLTSSGWGDKFKKPEGSWNCSDCMITNTSSTFKCVACGAKKPGTDKVDSSTTATEPKFSFGIPLASSDTGFTFGSKPTEKAEEKPTSSGGFRFGEAVASAPATGFSFGVPPSTTAAAPISSTSTAALPSTTSSTVAVTSVVTPAASEKPFFSFGVPKQSTDDKPKSTDSAAAKEVPTFRFGQVPSESPESSRKRKSTTDIAASSTSEPFKLPVSTPMFSAAASSAGEMTTAATSSEAKPTDSAASHKVTPSFSFSNSQITSSPTSLFKFGGDSAVGTTSSITASPVPTPSAEAPKASQEIKPVFSSSGPTFTFGQSSTDASKPAEAPKPAVPSFGASIESPKPTFTFGQSSSEISEPAEAPKPTFTFGQSSSEIAKPAEAPKPTFIFGQSSEMSKPGEAPKPTITFGAKAAETPKPTITFGAKPAEAPKPMMTFGAKPAEAPKPMITFGAKPAEAPKPTMTFGAVASEAASANKPSFSFGQPSSEALKPAETAKPTVTFGATGDASSAKLAFTFKAASDTAAKPIGGFGSPPGASAAPVFGSSMSSFPAMPTFGSTSSASTVPAFGSSATATPSDASATATSVVSSAPTGGSVFGGAPISSPAPPFGSAFGASSDKAENKSQGVFTFGAAKPAGPPPFTFGATGAAPAPVVNGPTSQKAPEFVFGSQSAAPKAFSAFSATPNNNAAQPPQAFSFGAGAAQPTFGAATSNAASIFGSGNVPSFGAPAQPTFNAPAPTAAPQFNFQPNTQQAPGVFSFGAGQPTQNAGLATPFAFSKPPMQSPPTFNPNATPNFNFTAGNTVNFTATPGEAKPMPPRVFKKAMRRTTPR